MLASSREFIELTNQQRENSNFAFVFKQQLIQTWHPKINTKCAALTYIAIAGMFIALGISIFATSSYLFNRTWRYSDMCAQIGAPCTINFQLSQSIISPIYIYYSINGFYQNHKAYTKSISYSQLYDGVMYNTSMISPDCDPIVYNKDLPYTTAVDGSALDPNGPAFPCGYVASTIFNDTFTIINVDTNSTVLIDNTKISPWSNSPKYKNANLSLQWIDVEDERFANWMQLSLFSNFQKVWGVINVNMVAGNYMIVIQNNWNSGIFKGTKSIVLTQLGPLANASEFLGYAYISMGTLCVVLAIVFSFRGLRKPKGIVEDKSFKS